MMISVCGRCGRTCYLLDGSWIYECTCNNFDWNLQGPQQINYVPPPLPQMPQSPLDPQRWQRPWILQTPPPLQRSPATPPTSSQPPLQDPSLMFNNNPALMRTALQAVGSQGPSPVSQLAAVESQKIWDAQDKALHAQLSHEARNVPVRVLGKHRMICCLCHKETPIRPAKNDGIHCTTCFTRRLSSGQQLVTIERQREYNTKQAAIAAAKARKEALINGNPTAAQSLAPYEPANKRVKLSPSMPSQSRATQAHTPLPSADLLSTNSTFSQILLPAAPTLPNSAFHGQILPSAERFVGRGSTASPTPAPKPLTIQEALKRARPKEQESREIQEDEDEFDRMVRHALEKELGKMA